MTTRWIRVASCALIFASLATVAGAAPPRASKPASERKEPAEKAKPAQPTRHELKDQNVRFETPDDWLPGAAGAGCQGAHVFALHLPINPVRIPVKPGEKMPSVPPAGYASSFTLVVNPKNVDGSSLESAVESMQAQIKKISADASFTPAKDVKVADEPGKQFVASFEIPSADGGPPIPRKQTVILTRRAGMLYRLALQSSVPNFGKDRTALDRVIRTFAWLDARAPTVAGAKTAGHPMLDKIAEHGLQLQMPSGWNIGQSSIPGSIAVFLPPDDAQGHVNLFTRDPQGKDAEAVLATLQSEIRSHDANAKIDPTEDATLGGEPARMFTNQVKLADGERSSLTLASVHSGRA